MVFWYAHFGAFLHFVAVDLHSALMIMLVQCKFI